MNDQMTTPLGVEEERPKNRIVPYLLTAGGAMLSAAIVLMIGWVFLNDDPMGGEPIAIAAIDRSPPRDVAPSSRSEPGQPQPMPQQPGGGETAQRETLPSGPVLLRVPQPGEDPSGPLTPQAVRTSEPPALSASGGLPFEPDPNLVEKVRTGLVPKVSSAGLRPMDIYARPVDNSSEVAQHLPKIAVVISGLGLSQTATHKTLQEMPGEVTLAFAPYGNSLDRWTRRAREQGHEYLIQMPMEPFDYPDNDPGPHTLLTGLDDIANQRRMHWVLSRITSYVGVMNYMGARFTSDQGAYLPMLDEILDRGLLFLDDGSSARSRTQELAGADAEVLRGNIVLDTEASPQAIESRLLQLESYARERGAAVGVATALPISIDKISTWARTLRSRGFVLVPLSSLLRTPVAVSQAR